MVYRLLRDFHPLKFAHSAKHKKGLRCFAVDLLGFQNNDNIIPTRSINNTILQKSPNPLGSFMLIVISPYYQPVNKTATYISQNIPRIRNCIPIKWCYIFPKESTTSHQ